jgi:hypothetical protein
MTVAYSEGGYPPACHAFPAGGGGISTIHLSKLGFIDTRFPPPEAGGSILFIEAGIYCVNVLLILALGGQAQPSPKRW